MTVVQMESGHKRGSKGVMWVGASWAGFLEEPRCCALAGARQLMETLAFSPGSPEVSRISCRNSFEQRRQSGVLGKGDLSEWTHQAQPWQSHEQGISPKST